MKLDVLKTLWTLRFEKMKRIEQEAAWSYQEILDEFLLEPEKFGEEIKCLREMVREERNHALLADELLRICRRTHPECEVY